MFEKILELKKVVVIKSEETQKVLYATDDVDTSFGLYQLKEGLTQVTVGYNNDNTIVFQNPYVKDRKIIIQIVNGQIVLNKEKDDYIYVNRLKSYADVIPIRSGDEIFWVGLIIIFFKNIVLF